MKKLILFVSLSLCLAALTGCQKRTNKKKVTKKLTKAQRQQLAWESKIKGAGLKLNKVRHAKLAQLAKGMTRGKVEVLIRKARYGSLSDFSWRTQRFQHKLYYIRKDHGLLLSFNAQQQLTMRRFVRCNRKGKVSFDELRASARGAAFADLKWLHNASKIDAWTFNPTTQVKIANKLHKKGKQQILALFRAYYQLTKTNMYCRHRYDLDEQRVLLLMQMLFVGPNKKPISPLLIGTPDVHLPGKQRSAWPYFPMAVKGGVPFLLVQGYTPENATRNTLDYIQYCTKHCTLRKNAFSPKMSPPQALSALVSSKRWKTLFSAPSQNVFGKSGGIRLWGHKKGKSIKVPKKPKKVKTTLIVKRGVKFPQFEVYHRALLRGQTLRAMKHIFQHVKHSGTKQPIYLTLKNNATWTHIQARIQRHKPRWDASTQQWKKTR
ncbi:MAG: hypothetical protein CL920_05555 [Deltaproteobacteria bacterium]|nr:hypothetical protein [Deltaproteobacteria bacterium]MBU48147.1 hypothetical protein [Deltaproteobacteria bacterium]|tara:strand:+ start:18111 stop:19412 length:1302 start_codon:yes stop_codon:yes gene_type:complete